MYIKHADIFVKLVTSNIYITKIRLPHCKDGLTVLFIRHTHTHIHGCTKTTERWSISGNKLNADNQ